MLVVADQVRTAGGKEGFPGLAVKFRLVAQEQGALENLFTVGAGDVKGLKRFGIESGVMGRYANSDKARDRGNSGGDSWNGRADDRCRTYLRSARPGR